MEGNFKGLFFHGSLYPFRESIIKVFDAKKVLEDAETSKEIYSIIIQLKGNKILKGLVSLEKIFDRNYRCIQDTRGA